VSFNAIVRQMIEMFY